MMRVRYVVCEVHEEPTLNSYFITYPCQWDVGTFVSSMKGVRHGRPIWLTPVDGHNLVWSRDYNRRFRWNHLIKDYTNHFDATVLLNPIRSERGIYSSAVAKKYIIPYLVSLQNNPQLDKDPEHAAQLKQFTEIFEACAEQPDTVVLIGGTRMVDG